MVAWIQRRRVTCREDTYSLQWQERRREMEATVGAPRRLVNVHEEDGGLTSIITLGMTQGGCENDATKS